MSRTKQERFTTFITNCTAEQKIKLQNAASLLELSLEEFILQSSLEKSDLIFSEEDTLQLTLKDQELLVEYLISPEKPNHALVKAKDKYDKK